MKNQIELGDITADIALKDIKNVHLSVYPPSGNVRISAPSHMNIDTIRVFALTKTSLTRIIFFMSSVASLEDNPRALCASVNKSVGKR